LEEVRLYWILAVALVHILYWAAKIVGEQGRVYALDKEALDKLMQNAASTGLRNIERMETSGETRIELTDESVDVVLLFDVFHSYHFPRASDRTRLLSEFIES